MGPAQAQPPLRMTRAHLRAARAHTEHHVSAWAEPCEERADSPPRPPMPSALEGRVRSRRHNGGARHPSRTPSRSLPGRGARRGQGGRLLPGRQRALALLRELRLADGAASAGGIGLTTPTAEPGQELAQVGPEAVPGSAEVAAQSLCECRNLTSSSAKSRSHPQGAKGESKSAPQLGPTLGRDVLDTGRDPPIKSLQAPTRSDLARLRAVLQEAEPGIARQRPPSSGPRSFEHVGSNAPAWAETARPGSDRRLRSGGVGVGARRWRKSGASFLSAIDGAAKRGQPS